MDFPVFKQSYSKMQTVLYVDLELPYLKCIIWWVEHNNFSLNIELYTDCSWYVERTTQRVKCP